MIILPLAKTLLEWLMPLLLLAQATADRPPQVEAPPAAATSTAVVAVAPAVAQAPAAVTTPAVQAATWTRITFYDCVPGGYCRRTATGAQVAEGHAACDRSRLGWQFRIVGDPTGRTYTCTDTGSMVRGPHVDVWFYAAADGWRWLRAVGSYATVEWLAPGEAEPVSIATAR